MNLSTSYLGLELSHPLIVGASPVADNIDQVRAAEDAGASAIVMRSLFEEQILDEDRTLEQNVDTYDDAHVEAAGYLPHRYEYELTPDAYLKQLRLAKEAVAIPVIGSLNGVTPGAWLNYAKLIADAGADALELNLYALSSRTDETCAQVEERHLEVVRQVRSVVSIPVAVKLAPFYSALPNFAGRLALEGAQGLVLFNRFYQPDIDIEQLEVRPKLELSTSSELLLRLRWLAMLSPTFNGSLAVSGGVHNATDALKALMAGAHAVQLVSLLLHDGVRRIGELRDGIARWLEEHEYNSLRQAIGSMNLHRCPNPAAYERANYIQVLNSWSRS